MQIRALHEEDLSSVAELSANAFGFDISQPAAAERWRRRLAHGLRTDPAGAFVAEQDGMVIGAAQALRRERLWCLSLLAVFPQAQSAGAGRALLDRTLAYGANAEAGLIPSSSDARALRLYAKAGFTLRPTFEASGAIDLASLPERDPDVRDAGPGDLEDLAVISREIRGAPHTAEIQFALEAGGQLLRLANRGFAVAMPGHGVWLLVARDAHAASSLMYASLGLVASTDRPCVRWITGEQTWAVEAALRAGLQLTPYGALCVRGNPGTLQPFIPSGPFA